MSSHETLNESSSTSSTMIMQISNKSSNNHDNNTKVFKIILFIFIANNVRANLSFIKDIK